MLSLNSDTLGKLSEQAVHPKRKFTFNGVDETDRCEVLPSITRQADEVSTGYATVEVYNGGKYWNKLKDNPEAYLRQEGVISLEILTNDSQYLNRWGNKKWDELKWYSGETLNIFTGRLDDFKFRGDKAFLVFRDKLGYLFDRKIGTKDIPIDFYSATGWLARDYSSGINPADMVWYLLTDPDMGDLDNTASSANVDINYTEWSTWKTQMTSLGFLLQGNFTGQTIGNILKKIMTYSHSTIFAEGDGLIYCRYWLEEIIYSPDLGGSDDFDVDNILSKPNLNQGVDDIINRVTIFYGYDPDTAGTPPDPTWAGHRGVDENANLADTDSQSTYGLRPKNYEDTVIWIPSSAAADSFGERIILWWKDPKKELEFNAGLTGFPHQLSDALRVNYPLFGVYFSNTEGYTLKELTMDVMTGLCSWKLKQVGFKQYFILDDAVNGLLDEAYNPLF